MAHCHLCVNDDAKVRCRLSDLDSIDVCNVDMQTFSKVVLVFNAIQ